MRNVPDSEKPDASSNAAEPDRRNPNDAIHTLDICITAAEAYPKLEHAFLDARKEITCSFRVFDFCTKLHSDAARKTGETWLDLMIHTLDRGVKVRLVVTDFDAVAAPRMHQVTWRTGRQVAAVRELADKGDNLTFMPALHDAAVGPFPRLIYGPLVRRKLAEIRDLWGKMTNPQRSRFRQETPHLRDIVIPQENGNLATHPTKAALVPATHHQKIAVFDREYLSIGGLDVNDRRYDTKDHRRAAARTWHDVQAFARGPIAESAACHLDTFLDTVAGDAPAAPTADHFLRTVSQVRLRNIWRSSPRTVVEELRQQHLDDAGKAEHLVYLETQFMRHLPIARALAKRAQERPDLRLIMILPAAPEDIAFSGNWGLDARYGEHLQVRCLRLLERAFGPDRLIVSSPVQPRTPQPEDGAEGRNTLRGAPLIYVHSKISLFDDTSGIVSSANLNGRSMRWDTETGLHLTDADHTDQLRRRVMGNWLPDSLPNYEDFFNLEHGFDAWRTLIDSNSHSPPAERQGFLVRYDSDAAREAATALPGIPEEAV